MTQRRDQQLRLLVLDAAHVTDDALVGVCHVTPCHVHGREDAAVKPRDLARVAGLVGVKEDRGRGGAKRARTLRPRVVSVEQRTQAPNVVKLDLIPTPTTKTIY